MKGLTKRQHELLSLLQESIEKNGYAPTVRELADLLRVRSPSAIFKHLKSLEQKGLIRQEEKKARSIELLDTPKNGKNVAIVGSIAHAEKIEFFAKSSETAFPEHLLPKESASYYAFFIKDQSFNDVQLLQGDVVAIDSTETEEDRKMVLATAQDGGVIIGSYSREKQGIRIGEKHFLDDEIKILGTLTALLRSY